MARDPRARAAAADLRLGDVRRRRHHPRPHVRVTERIASETSLHADGHLTCVGAHARRAALGDRRVRRRRGAQRAGAARRPAGRSAPAVGAAPRGARPRRRAGRAGPGARRLLRRRRGVPRGHPAAASLEADAQVLAAKADAGAEFAITQMFFGPPTTSRLVDRVARWAATSRSSRASCRSRTSSRSRGWPSCPGCRCRPRSPTGCSRSRTTRPPSGEVGIEIATELCEELLAGGAPGLHFYTLNRSTATREVFLNLRSSVVS